MSEQDVAKAIGKSIENLLYIMVGILVGMCHSKRKKRPPARITPSRGLCHGLVLSPGCALLDAAGI